MAELLAALEVMGAEGSTQRADLRNGFSGLESRSSSGSGKGDDCREASVSGRRSRRSSSTRRRLTGDSEMMLNGSTLHV